MFFKLKKINVQKELTHIKDITVIESSSIETLNSFDIVIPIFHKKTALAYLLIGDLEEELIAISPGIKHMPFIQTLASIIVVAIENKRFSLELIEQELDKKEMEMAAEMQKLLFPTNLPNDENIDVLFQEGLAGFIQKPYRIEELSRKLDEILGK